METEKTIVCSFSGGRSSGFMAAYLNARYSNIINVFANTGKEHPLTLDFINQCDKVFKLNLVWLEYVPRNAFKVVNYQTADRSGAVFESLIKERGLPTPMVRLCTRELKERTIDRYLSSIGIMPKSRKMAIGIRADEAHRKGSKYYPLIDEIPITRQFIIDWWRKQPFDLQTPAKYGNCDFCFMKSLRKRIHAIDRAQWWHEMESKYGNDKAPFFDVRNKISVAQIMELKETQSLQMDFAIEYGCCSL